MGWKNFENDQIAREKILGLLDTTWMKLLYYERKEDDEFGVDDIEDAILDGVISVDDMVSHFRDQLQRNVRGRESERAAQNRPF